MKTRFSTSYVNPKKVEKSRAVIPSKKNKKKTALMCSVSLVSLNSFKLLLSLLTRNELRIWIRRDNKKMEISRVVILANDNLH